MNTEGQMETFSTKIGSLLVQEGFVTQDDIVEALAIQRQDEKETGMPFADILQKKGFLTKDQLHSLMVHPETQRNIRELLLKRKMVDDHHLNECFRQKKPNESVGDVLVRKRLLSAEALMEFLKKDFDGIKLGKLAVGLKMMTGEDFEAALKFKRFKRGLGEILCDLNLITLSELNIVFQKYNKRLKLGEILIQQGIIDKEALDNALRDQVQSEETLGRILVRKGLITIDQLYFALSVQYNIPFHNLDGFVFYKKQGISLRNIIGQKYAEQFLVIPLFQNGRNLTVALSNPSRIWVIDKLRSMYGQFVINAVLITDEKFEQLFVFLYGEFLSTDRSTEISKAEAGPADLKTVISDPEMDGHLITELYEQYAAFKKQLKEIVDPSDSPIFEQFIIENHKEICERFCCQRVSFSVEARNNQVEILAAPLVESSGIMEPAPAAERLI